MGGLAARMRGAGSVLQEVYGGDSSDARGECLLLNPDFPHSIRFAVDRINAALNLIGDLTERRAKLPTRIAGRLRAQLSFSQIEEIMAESITTYLQGIRNECAGIHAAIHGIYFDYSIDAELAS